MSKQSEILKDYSQKDWEAFKTMGMGKIFFQFLKDSRELKRKQCLSLFDIGEINEKNLDFIKQRQMAALITNELVNLELNDIVNFYEEIEDEQV